MSSLRTHIEKLSDGNALTAGEAEDAISRIMEGEATPVEISGLLVALRTRGPTAREVAGGVRAMRRAMVSLPVDAAGVVDTCGTGGGSLTTFNISTVAALVTAAAGVPVAKHGNRSYSSKCGSADVLEALEVNIELPPERAATLLEESGFVFMFAPAYHPAMRHVASVRRALGFDTVFNLLGPLTNPAGVERQVVGVADPSLLDLVAGALQELGHERAMVVHGSPGMDELSPLGPTRTAVVEGGERREVEVRPEQFGWEDLDAEELAGGVPERNARIAEQVLRGEGSRGAEGAVALNAGAALWAGGAADDLAEGVRRAREVIASGAGWEKLEEVREASA